MTAQALIGIYCRGHHGTKRSLCGECDAMWQYTRGRLHHCPFHAGNPRRLNCTAHCFEPAVRENLRTQL